MTSPCTYVLVDPPSTLGNPGAKGFRVENAPQRHLVNIKGFELLWDRVEHTTGTVLDDQAKAAIRKTAINEGITPYEAFLLFGKVIDLEYVGEAPNAMRQYLFKSFKDKSKILGMDEDSLTAILETAVSEQIAPAKACEIFTKIIACKFRGDIPDPISRHMRRTMSDEECETRLAIATFPPPIECPKCSETNWQLLSISPNQKAAKWKCVFCGRTLLARRKDKASSTASASKRKSIPKSVQRDVWRRDDGRCVDCGTQEDLEFDHIIPVARGGSNTTRNIQLLCEQCNRKKSDSAPGEY